MPGQNSGATQELNILSFVFISQKSKISTGRQFPNYKHNLTVPLTVIETHTGNSLGCSAEHKAHAGRVFLRKMILNVARSGLFCACEHACMRYVRMRISVYA